MMDTSHLLDVMVYSYTVKRAEVVPAASQEEDSQYVRHTYEDVEKFAHIDNTQQDEDMQPEKFHENIRYKIFHTQLTL